MAGRWMGQEEEEEEEEEEEVWGGAAVCHSCVGLQALVGVMEPLSRVSGGPLCPPRLCTPTARLRASATSRRNRIFLEDIEKNVVLTVSDDPVAAAEASFGFGRTKEAT